MQPQTSSAEWFYLDAVNQSYGPVPLETILTLRQSFDFFVWRDGFSEWVLASSLPSPEPQAAQQCASPEPNQKKRKTSKPPKALVQLCQEIVADSFITPGEAQLLHRWIKENRDKCTDWPANALCERVEQILADGVVDTDEYEDLFTLVSQLAEMAAPASGSQQCIDPNLFDSPPPIIEFEEKRFCLVGKFVYGTSSKCKEAISIRGGSVTNITSDVDYIVLGSFGCKPDKLSEVVTIKNRKTRPFIVTESLWFDALEKSGEWLTALYQNDDGPTGIELMDSSNFALPSHEGWFGGTETIRSFSGGGDYKINLRDHSCTCPDFHETRSVFLPGDIRRACKHICKVLLDKKIPLPSHLHFVLQQRVEQGRGMPNGPWYAWGMLEGHMVFFGASQSDWVNLIAPSITRKGVGPYADFGYSVVDGRWSYGNQPFRSKRLEKFIRQQDVQFR